MIYLPINEIKDISSELQHSLSLCNVKSVYKNKIKDLVKHIEYSIWRSINSAYDIIHAIELLNNKIIYGNFDAECANEFVLHSHYNPHNYLKLNYDLEYINRDFDMLNYESKKLVLDDILQEYKREFFGTGIKNIANDGFEFGNIKKSDSKQRELFLKKLTDTCNDIFKEDEYFKNKYARDILTDKLNILNKNYFLVEKFENMKVFLNKDYIINNKLIDIFENLEQIVLISEEYHLGYKIPIEYCKILDDRIEKETLSIEEKYYLNNLYSPLMLDMIDCGLKYFNSKEFLKRKV